MYRTLIEQASHEQLKHFTNDAMSMLKETNHDTYETLQVYLYKELYGCHFNDWMLKQATEHMVNEDGTTGGKWSLDETNSVARQYGVKFQDFNEYDWNYTMNMIHSDYYGAVPNDVGVYVKMALRFLNDKDAPEGKALKYYLTFKE